MTIQHKRIIDTGRAPSPAQLSEGEICINLPDRTIYSKDDSGNVIEIGAGGGGGGLPVGGTTGQHLSKVSNTDGDAEWTDVPQELPDGGTIGQTLVKSSSTDGDVEWSDAPNDLPVGGGTGQVLAKVDNTDYNVAWVNQPGGGSSMPDFIVKSAVFTADKENGYLCSVGGGGFTVTLPTASDSDWLVIGDFDGNCSILNPIVITSSQNIHSSSDDLIITSSNAMVWLQYINANDSDGNVVGWKIVDGIGEGFGGPSGGATGSFISADGKTITVTNGLITNIV